VALKGSWPAAHPETLIGREDQLNKYDEGQFEEAARCVVKISSAIIAGDIGIIEGVRELALLGHAIADDFDPDFMPFVAIDSETDHLPVGKVRELWSTKALRDKDKEIKEAEKLYRDKAQEACRKLINRYGANG
jgi:hypothetical protein